VFLEETVLPVLRDLLANPAGNNFQLTM